MTVTYEVSDGVAVIAIDRLDRRNAINRETADALLAAWRRFDDDPQAHVAVLTGRGSVFCSGADLKDFDLIDRPEGHLGFTHIGGSKPTIAAVEGYAVAGGLELALWCDLRVAAQDAVFGCYERRFGVPLIDGGTQRLPRIVGMGRAMDMVLTGRAVLADEALRIGLANRVVPTGQALSASIELARSITRFPQATVRSDRLAMLEGAGTPIAEGLRIERRHGLSVMDTARIGARRFSEGEGRHGAGAEPMC
jgi:enoyl-CoA hydratase